MATGREVIANQSKKLVFYPKSLVFIQKMVGQVLSRAIKGIRFMHFQDHSAALWSTNQSGRLDAGNQSGTGSGIQLRHVEPGIRGGSRRINWGGM